MPAHVTAKLADMTVVDADLVLDVKDRVRERWKGDGFEIDWSDLPSFDSRASGVPPACPRVRTTFIGFETTDVEILSSGVARPFKVELDGGADGKASVTVGANGSATTDPPGLDVEARRSRTEFTAPFRLRPGHRVRITLADGTVKEIDVVEGVNYVGAGGRFKLRACFPLDGLTAQTTPAKIELCVELGSSTTVDVAGCVTVTPTKITARHWSFRGACPGDGGDDDDDGDGEGGGDGDEDDAGCD